MTDQEPATHVELAAAAGLGLLIGAAAIARGAHDVWAGTAALVAAWVLLAALLARDSWTGRGGLPLSLTAPSALLAAALWLSWRRSVNPGESLLGLRDWLCGLAVFLAAGRCLRTDAAVWTLLACLAPVFCVEPFAMAGQRLESDYVLTDQVAGTLVNANIAAGLCLLWLPPLADIVLRTRRATGKVPWPWAIAAAGNLIALVMTRSAWAMICLLIAAPFMAGPAAAREWRRRHPRGAALLAGLLVAVVGALLWRGLTTDQAVTGLRLIPGERTLRLQWWGSAWRMFLDHPWTGVGIGAFGSAYPAYRAPTLLNTRHAHGFPAALLAETGLIGGAGIILFAALWLRGVRGADASPSRRWPFLLGLSVFGAHAAVNVSLEYLVNLMSACAAGGLLAARAPEPLSRRGRAAAFVLASSLLAAIPWAAAPFQASRLEVAAEGRLSAGDLAGALAGFEAAAARTPEAFEPYRGMARTSFRLFLEKGDPRHADEAVRSQRRAAQLNRLSGLLLSELGAYQLAAGRPQDARKSLQKALALDSGKAPWRRETEALLRRLGPAGPK